jgi:toxin-antitoxin system PIN domain toxin
LIAIDTNLLVYAHRRDSPWHQRAAACIKVLAQGREAWSIPWPCIHEFLAIVTHPRIYAPPSRLEQAVDQVDAWLESPTLSLLNETHDHWEQLKTQLSAARITGPAVHDARVVALCLAHGVRELYTADRDFNRFPSLTCRNPLIA